MKYLVDRSYTHLEICVPRTEGSTNQNGTLRWNGHVKGGLMLGVGLLILT